MDNIFIPFYTTRTKGSGIGLSFAKQIMRLHNGKISVKSDIGKGAEFILRF
jgi:two-component system nitrogen regulation sensor histidine kinase NtrY